MEIYILVECYQNRRFNIAAYYIQANAYKHKRYLETYVVNRIEGVTYEIERMIVT